jgi:hypothetical protein
MLCRYDNSKRLTYATDILSEQGYTVLVTLCWQQRTKNN